MSAALTGRPTAPANPIEWSTTAVFDDDGALNYIIGAGAGVTTRRQMQRDLDEAQRQVAQAKEAERVWLAQDLHDGAVQRLLGLSYQLAEMRRRAMEEGAWTPAQRLEELAPGLEVLRGDIIDVAQGLRRLISSLRPPALHEMGLVEVLDVYVADWQQGAGNTLRKSDGFALVGVAVNTNELGDLVADLQPDVLLLDLHMPGPPPPGNSCFPAPAFSANARPHSERVR